MLPPTREVETASRHARRRARLFLRAHFTQYQPGMSTAQEEAARDACAWRGPPKRGFAAWGDMHSMAPIPRVRCDPRLRWLCEETTFALRLARSSR